MKNCVTIMSILYMGVCMAMQGEQVERAFDVIGIAARTSNKAEMNGAGVIGALWQRFFSEKILERIPNKVGNDIVALYTDCASDKDGEYTIIIGAQVSSTDNVPAGYVECHVPAEMRKVFVAELGDPSHVVLAAWQGIWSLEDAGKLIRSYRVDYEFYDMSGKNPVEIHVGVK